MRQRLQQIYLVPLLTSIIIYGKSAAYNDWNAGKTGDSTPPYGYYGTNYGNWYTIVRYLVLAKHRPAAIRIEDGQEQPDEVNIFRSWKRESCMHLQEERICNSGKKG